MHHIYLTSLIWSSSQNPSWMVKWVVWSFSFSMQQWAHTIVFIMPVIQMDLGARSQQFIVVVTTKTLPNSSDFSSSRCLPRRLAKWGRRHVCEILLAMQLVGFFIFTIHFFKSSSIEAPAVLWWLIFPCNFSFLWRIHYCHVCFAEKILFSPSSQCPAWRDPAVRGSSGKFLLIVDILFFILLRRAESCVVTTDQHNLMIFSWQFPSFSAVQLHLHCGRCFLYKFLVQEYYSAEWRTSVIPA